MEEKIGEYPDNSETAVESVQLAGVQVVRNPMGEVLELEGMERAVRVEASDGAKTRRVVR